MCARVCCVCILSYQSVVLLLKLVVSVSGLPTRAKTPSSSAVGGQQSLSLSPTSTGLPATNSASRSSGFAAALRKLAQQAESPPGNVLLYNYVSIFQYP